MTDFFPTDVQVRSDGQIIGTQLLGQAKQMMTRANLIRSGGGDDMPVQLRSTTEEGEINVLMYGRHKIITIHPTPKNEPVGSVPSIYLLCGMIRDGKVHIDGTTGKRYLRHFRPTLATATSRHIENAFADNERLCPPTGGDGTDTQYVRLKASMFSGAMTRVAQAVQGLGKVDDASGFYLTRPSATRYVTLNYDYTHLRTHGIYKSGIRNHWLVEISKANGVMAMPLPLIPSTVGTAYRTSCKNIGDTGSYEVVNEFGGLPSGETFPTGAALTKAITDGKVLQLMTATEMAPFYVNTRRPRYAECGWAFSNSGYFARNTCVSYIIYHPGQLDEKFLQTGEHWEVALNLSKYTLHPLPGDPVGTGSASLERIHVGREFIGNNSNVWDPNAAPTEFNLWYPSLGVETLSRYAKSAELEVDQFIEFGPPLGSIVHTWFEDDVPRNMKWVYQFSNGTAEDDGGLPHFITYHAEVSPTAFVSGISDLRQARFFDSKRYVLNDVCCNGGPIKGVVDVIREFEGIRELCAGGGNSDVCGDGVAELHGGQCAMDDTELQKWIISEFGTFINLTVTRGWYWAFLPAYCREGCVMGASYATEITPQSGTSPASGPASALLGEAGKLVVNGIGRKNVLMLKGSAAYPFVLGYGPGSWFRPPMTGQYVAFGAMPGYGTTDAYVHTKHMQNNQTPDHQYVYNNTLDGAQLTQIGKLNFIGSIT